MKNALIIFLLVGLSACQSYPKNPASVSVFTTKTTINKTVPIELQPYMSADALQKNRLNYSPLKVVDKSIVPPQVYVFRANETIEDVDQALKKEAADKAAIAQQQAGDVPAKPEGAK